MNVSDKVVCVDDNWASCRDDPRKYFSALPVKGQTYVVERVMLARNGEPQICLVGIEGNLHNNGTAGFYPHRFRLLSDLKSEAVTRQTLTPPMRTRLMRITSSLTGGYSPSG